jgi:N-acetylated-alpha-linked acidic dipeptidase
VEFLVEDSLGSKPDFSALRDAISNVQTASANLDKEKQEALEAFDKLLKHLPPYPSTLLIQRLNHYDICNPNGRWKAPPQTVGRLVKDWVRSIFGFPSATVTAASWDMAKLFDDDTWEGVLSYALATMNETDEDELLPPWLPRPIKKFIEAARRLGRSNKKLIAFERGFISEDGIKEREWYKHLGVAPGKWLGKSSTFVFLRLKY